MREFAAEAARLALALGPAIDDLDLLRSADPCAVLHELWPHADRYWRWRAVNTPEALLASTGSALRRLRALGGCLAYRAERNYPRRLLRLNAPPPVVFLRGYFPRVPLVALVGSRAASGRAMDFAHRLASELVASGYGVVSGGALGIDAEAHAGALAAGGKTVAVLGSGLGVLYPERNRRLFAEIVHTGVLMTTHPPADPPRAGHFPARNRLIAALSDAVVIVAASARSGALITARHAQDLGIPVACGVFGQGCRQLLRRGAAPVGSAAEALDMLRGDRSPSRRSDPDDALLKSVRDALCGRPLSLNELATKLQLKLGQAAVALLRLEMQGWVSVGANGRYRTI